MRALRRTLIKWACLTVGALSLLLAVVFGLALYVKSLGGLIVALPIAALGVYWCLRTITPRQRKETRQ